jgi:hypothetical protein
MIASLYCPACECPGAVRTLLGYFGDDGTTGRVAGIACRSCGYIAADPEAAYIPEGRVDLHGMTAREWLLAGLRAAGCNPKRRG